MTDSAVAVTMSAATLQSTRDEAVARAERIRASMNSLATLQEDLIASYHRRDWTALGYASWEDYTEGEFSEKRQRLSRERRREIVSHLRIEGLSTRAIGAALGVNQSTVVRDLPGDANASRAGANSPVVPVVGTDGKSYAPTRPPITAEELDQLRPENNPTPPQPRPRRRPITEAATDAGWEIRKATERVGKILGDTRYTANQQQVPLSLRAHLLFARDQITAALDNIGEAD
jgi:hypothetical protein